MDQAGDTSNRRVAGKPRVIVTRHLLPSIEARMEELFETRLNRADTPMTREDLAAAMRECDVLVPTVTDRIDAELIAQAGESLGLIASFGAGTDHIDLAAAAARRIMVTNTPGVFTDDTADLTMALIIGVPRRLREGTTLIRRERWTGWAPSAMLGHKLGGKVLGIVGMGRIGQAVAFRARAFGLQIQYHNRHRLPQAVESMFGAEYVEKLDDLLTRSDIVTLHCPATTQTEGMINARRIGLMKQGAALINTARANLIDYEAMIDALESGHLGGAGLDVFPEEPKVDARLVALPNVIAQPHIGSATVEGREASGEKVIANIRFWADGHRPPDQVLEALV
ncbi:2-hydroxyacid dehydrogenase [Pelagerythrobacter rhizovicinus]|uniref:D-glycerate dehydrogenase n=1 Tax=Pelagerythrobacter rhizovicinus TaxID=2268576 RepID=A0A4Q2KQW6_9SPHN|nr:D-glycerate dehydrogenase [Pelagerythrobacter rhizovicinus]RXZ66022.1 D-glycerate dehydrogenase [Pelagerythrobacter rhizovicinus]